MSFNWFLGFLIGNVLAVGVLVLRLRQLRRRGELVADERTELIRARAGATAFYATAGLTYLLWIADVISTFLRGGKPQLVTPLFSLLLAMAVIWKGAHLYHHNKLSTGELDERERREKRRAAMGALPGAIFLLPGALLGQQSDIPFLPYLMYGLMLAMLAMIIFTLIRTRTPRA